MKNLKRIFAFLFAVLLPFTLFGCLSKGDSYMSSAFDYFHEGNYESALPLFKEAEKSGTELYSPSEVNNLVGRCHQELGEYEQAIGWYTRAVEEDGKNYRAYVNMGICRRLLGEYDKALEAYQAALLIEPDYAELHSSLGSLYIYMNRPYSALECFKKAIALSPDLAVAHGNMALAYAMTGDFAAAEEALETAGQKGYENVELIREKIELLKEDA